MNILALDLGKFNTVYCFFNSKTRQHEFLSLATERNYLTTVLNGRNINLVVMEAMNELKAVHMPSEDHRELRSLVKYRKTHSLGGIICPVLRPPFFRTEELERHELQIRLCPFQEILPRTYDHLDR